MNKDFSESKLLAMNPEKQLRVLYDLASFIEQQAAEINSSHFEKLKKYHHYLKNSDNIRIQKLNKEFIKISNMDYQFQVYLMNLERFLGQSKKEYDFLVNTGDEKHNQRSEKRFPITCLLDSIRSAHNVGSFFRNAECFGTAEILLCGLSPTPKSIQVKKTAMGCDELVKWRYEQNACIEVKKLKELGATIWAIETSSTAIHINDVLEIPTPLVLIFGHEQHGISHELLELSDKIIDITLYGSKNSLNVSVSQAVVLNHITGKIMTGKHTNSAYQ